MGSSASTSMEWRPGRATRRGRHAGPATAPGSGRRPSPAATTASVGHLRRAAAPGHRVAHEARLGSGQQQAAHDGTERHGLDRAPGPGGDVAAAASACWAARPPCLTGKFASSPTAYTPVAADHAPVFVVGRSRGRRRGRRASAAPIDGGQRDDAGDVQAPLAGHQRDAPAGSMEAYESVCTVMPACSSSSVTAALPAARRSPSGAGSGVTRASAAHPGLIRVARGEQRELVDGQRPRAARGHHQRERRAVALLDVAQQPADEDGVVVAEGQGVRVRGRPPRRWRGRGRRSRARCRPCSARGARRRRRPPDAGTAALGAELGARLVERQVRDVAGGERDGDGHRRRTKSSRGATSVRRNCASPRSCSAMRVSSAATPPPAITMRSGAMRAAVMRFMVATAAPGAIGTRPSGRSVVPRTAGRGHRQVCLSTAYQTRSATPMTSSPVRANRR